MTSSQRDEKLFGFLTKLRRHLRTCTECSEARKALNLDGMCHDGKYLVLSAADEFDHIIDLKRKAAELGGGMVYACPDPSAHGMSYAITVRPMYATAMQDGLF